MELLEDGAWIAAIVAPWAIAPHPNFSEDSVSGPGLLALVTQFRLQDVDRYRELMPEANPPWVMNLIDAAYRSITIDTIRAGADELWEIAQDPEVTIGARVAAAMFASTAEVELDEISVAVSRLVTLAQGLTQDDAASRTSSLALAVLRQQIAARQFELFDYVNALATLQSVAAELSVRGRWDEFPVSLGISWDSASLQDDIHAALSSHRLELQSRLEGFAGSSWIEVVKSKSSWPDFRGQVVAAARDRKYVESVFDQRVGARGRRRRIMSSDPVITRALEALLHAELTGDVNGLMNGRAALGQLRILGEIEKSRYAEPWHFQDALRLFRRARAKENLQRALDSIYLQGPDTALINDAEVILRRTGFPLDVTVCDLMVLAAAAQYLSQEDLQRSIDAALEFMRANNQGSELADKQTALRSVVRLLPGSGRDNEAAFASLEVMRSGLYLDLMENDLIQLIDILNWDEVEPVVVHEWRDWGKSYRESGEPARELANRTYYLLKDLEHDDILANTPESDLPLYLALHKNEVPRNPDLLRRAEAASSETLRKIREDARQGKVGFGSTDAGELAVILASEFDRPELWSDITRFLADKTVPQELKERPLARIADLEPSRLPYKAEAAIRSEWRSIIETPRHDLFTDPDPTYKFSEALRVVTLGALTRDEAVAAGTELAGSRNPANRLASCELINNVATKHEEWTWAQILLLQLSRDGDANIRPIAARNLAVVGRHQTAVTSLVIAALEDCLKAGGIRVPLMTLHGLQREGSQAKVYGRNIAARVEEMATTHLARVVRDAAQHVIRGANFVRS